MQQSTLAGPGWTYDCDKLSFLDFEIHTSKRWVRDGTHMVRFGDIDCAEQWFHWLFC